MPEYPDYDRSETFNEMLRRSGKTLERHQRDVRNSRRAQRRADDELIAEEERERLESERGTDR